MCGLSDRHRTGFRVGRKGLLVPRTGSPILRNRPGVGPVCSVEQRTYDVISGALGPFLVDPHGLVLLCLFGMVRELRRGMPMGIYGPRPEFRVGHAGRQVR